jgi:Protein of unknown function (DUF4239)
VDIPVAILIIVSAAFSLFALVRAVNRRRPVITEPTRGTPMATVVGTTFAVTLAFVIFAAFQTYNGAQSAAGDEAIVILDMARTAALYPPSQRDELRADLACYGRAVVHEEWPAMRAGRASPFVDDWIAAYRDLFGRLNLSSPRLQLAFQDLLADARDRTHARQQRLDEATSSVPTPLWLALILGGTVTVLLQLGMADPRERLAAHGTMVAGVAAVVTGSPRGSCSCNSSAIPTGRTPAASSPHRCARRWS